MFLTIFILELFTVLTGLVFLRQNGPVILWVLLSLNIIGVINEELVTEYCWEWWHVEPNVFYNLYSLLDMIVWFLIFYFIFRNMPRIRIFVAASGMVILLYSMIELTVLYNWNIFHTRSFLCFSIAMLLFSIVYFWQVQRKEITHNLQKDAALWLCAAAVGFHSVFVLNLLTVLDPVYWSYPNTTRIFHTFQSIATIIHYLFICIAFISVHYKGNRNTSLRT